MNCVPLGDRTRIVSARVGVTRIIIPLDADAMRASGYDIGKHGPPTASAFLADLSDRAQLSSDRAAFR